MPVYRKYAIIILIILFLLFLILIRFFFFAKELNSSKSVNQRNSDEYSDVIVYVAGAVKEPGIYGLKKKSTVGDVLAKAIVRNDAELSGINKKELLRDAQVINIPQKFIELSQIRTEKKGGKEKARRININTASEKELEALPGVGPAIARNIVTYRKSKLFGSPKEILEVPGIGEKKFAAMEAMITIE